MWRPNLKHPVYKKNKTIKTTLEDINIDWFKLISSHAIKKYLILCHLTSLIWGIACENFSKRTSRGVNSFILFGNSKDFFTGVSPTCRTLRFFFKMSLIKVLFKSSIKSSIDLTNSSVDSIKDPVLVMQELIVLSRLFSMSLYISTMLSVTKFWISSEVWNKNRFLLEFSAICNPKYQNHR